MKTFKLVDWVVSASMILFFVGAALTANAWTAILGYFITGGWQILSMLIHVFNKWFTYKGSRRNYYHGIVAVILLFAAITLPLKLIMLVLLPMLFLAPVMAFYYTCMCYEEWKMLGNRPLAVLK